MTPSEKFKLVKEHHARLHRAISRNVILPVGLPRDARCRIEVVQHRDGVVESVHVEESNHGDFERAVLEAIARTSLPPPLRFPSDPQFLRWTSWFDFSVQDMDASSGP